MTATALAFDPAFDTALDLFDDGDGFGPTGPGRPQLRLIQGQGADRILPAVAPLAPSPSIEVYRRRRFFALVAVTAIVLGIAWAAGVSVTSFSGAQATGPQPVGVQTGVASEAAPLVHVVLPGDSYGAIAAELGATNAVAGGELLRAANGGGELVIGQRLVIAPTLLTSAG